jgi:hypothetical protein
MLNFGFENQKIEQPVPMPCLFTNKDLAELEAEGFKVKVEDENVILFNPENVDEWNKACAKASELLNSGENEVLFANNPIKGSEPASNILVWRKLKENYDIN